MQDFTTDKSIATEVVQTLTAQQAWHYSVLPYSLENGTILMYVAEGNRLRFRVEK